MKLKSNSGELVERVRLASALDCFTWIITNQINLGHSPWAIEGHEYQVGMLQAEEREQCCIKGAQMGITEVWVLKTLHGMIHGQYPAGSLYLFPTRDDVKDFSKARFDPLIDANPSIGAYVQSTDSQNIKRIGSGFLYLRGARATKTLGTTKKSSSQLKSIPVDRIVFDERDEMDDDMVQLAKERISHSAVKEIMHLGTPTIPDYGIDALYQKSTQSVWMIECLKCGKETCLELEFPNCIQRRTDGTAYRCCVHCGAEIHPAMGTWRSQYEKADMVGWWISQLNSIYIDPAYILDLYEDPPHGDLSEVMNSKLGRAYIPAENRLAPSDVWALTTQDPMAAKHEGPTCMGVDVGKNLNVVIAERKTRRTLKVVKVCEVGSFNDLHNLAKEFNVKSAVIDLKPEIRKVREFQRSENFQVFACDYVETRTGQTSWDDRDLVIKCNRTEICDATHELVTEPGRLELPFKNQEMYNFVKQMCNMAKILEEDERTGGKIFRYRKLGPDHYRHAMNYCLLASEHCGVTSEKKLMDRWFGQRKRRTAWTA